MPFPVSKQWQLVVDDAKGTAHVIPVNDLVSHEESEDCVCGPLVEHLSLSSGADGWMYSHYALDKRSSSNAH